MNSHLNFEYLADGVQSQQADLTGIHAKQITYAQACKVNVLASRASRRSASYAVCASL